MNRIRVLNAISEKGLRLFNDGYAVGKETADPDALIVRSAPVDVTVFPGLHAVARAGAGVNNINVAEATKHGIAVFNTPGGNANAVAELVFAVLGAEARNLGQAIHFAKTAEGSTDAELAKFIEKGKGRYSGFELAGKTLAVIGLGKIGVLVANAGVAKGMRVVGHDAFPTMANMHRLDARVEIGKTVEDAIAGADIVSLHVPLVPETQNLIGEKAISSMKNGAILVNYARDGIVDDRKAIEALGSEKLALYISDFPTKALIACPKVVCTPHLGASTAEAEENCAVMAVRALKDYLELGTVVNSVNFPALELRPRHGAVSRLAVVNRDKPDMIGAVAHTLGKAGINIQALANESNGTIGYSLADFECEIPEAVLREISKIDGVLKVRYLRFVR
ncbi:MAG TPA: 3-phosphoglycerate dehydrogenase family protein [Candidatus Paceibacterota bacterium]|nr:3-phosphoglycerate dehydrogenase family protein [Candidatus Paceibacterota bacterium]